MEASRTTMSITIELALEPVVAFGIFIEELVIALAQGGMSFEPGANGRITEGEFEVGRVIAWISGVLVQLQWHQADWESEEVTNVEMRFESINGGTRVTLEHDGWGGLIGDAGEMTGWFARTVASPFMQVTSPKGFGNWLTDRRARRPSGAQARNTYRDPLYHYPNFRVILQELALTSDDYLIEVGCGGGALLAEALKSGCRAAAIDHSPDMVQR